MILCYFYYSYFLIYKLEKHLKNYGILIYVVFIRDLCS